MDLTPFQFLRYKVLHEWSDFPVDAVFHPATLRASLRRIQCKLAIRFAHLPSWKRRLVQRSVGRILKSSKGSQAWAIHAEAFGETLFVIRNTANTLVKPSKRIVCRVVLEDVLGDLQCLHAEMEYSWVEGVVFATSFLIGGAMAWILFPYIHPPTVSNLCTFWGSKLF